MWYYNDGKAQHGPISGDLLVALIQSRQITPLTFVWREGMAEWAPAGHTELALQFNALPRTKSPKDIPRQPANPTVPIPSKNLGPRFGYKNGAGTGMLHIILATVFVVIMGFWVGLWAVPGLVVTLGWIIKNTDWDAP